MTWQRNPIQDQQTILRLIRLVQQYPCLWRDKDKSLKTAFRRKVAWKAISARLQVGVPILAHKWRNLTTTFIRVSKRMRHDMGTGSRDAQPSWFAYKALSFLESVPGRSCCSVTKVCSPADEHETDFSPSTEFLDSISAEPLEVKPEPLEESMEQIVTENLEDSGHGLPFIQMNNTSAPKDLHNGFCNVSQPIERKQRSVQTDNDHSLLAHSLDRLANEVHYMGNKKKTPCAAFGETIALHLEQFDRVNSLRIMGRITNLIQEEVERLNEQ